MKRSPRWAAAMCSRSASISQETTSGGKRASEPIVRCRASESA
jgi:hypothetical protein